MDYAIKMLLSYDTIKKLLKMMLSDHGKNMTNELVNKYISYYDKEHWVCISRLKCLSYTFVDEHFEELLCNYYPVPADIILKNYRVFKEIMLLGKYFIPGVPFKVLELDPNLVKIMNCPFDNVETLTKFVDKYPDKVDWNKISEYGDLSKEFVLKYIDKLDIAKVISHSYKICEPEFLEQIMNHIDNLDWLIEVKNMGTEFINKHKDKFSIECLCKYQLISIDEIMKYPGEIKEIDLSLREYEQELPDDFVIKFYDKFYVEEDTMWCSDEMKEFLVEKWGISHALSDIYREDGPAPESIITKYVDDLIDYNFHFGNSLSNELLFKYKDKLKYMRGIDLTGIGDDTIDKLKSYFNRRDLSRRTSWWTTEKLMKYGKYFERKDLFGTINKVMNDELFEKYIDMIPNDVHCNTVTGDLVIKYYRKFDIEQMLCVFKFTEDQLEMIIKKKYNVPYNWWNHISKFQDLTSTFIDKYTDKLNWTKIARHQAISRETYLKHCNRICKLYFYENKKIKFNRDYCRGTDLQLLLPDSLKDSSLFKLCDVWIKFE